uniref:Uncharacterized protein n=1 Tax=Oryza punctata TaxID=4537 RepID=A0A0E0KSR3_ORYPU
MCFTVLGTKTASELVRGNSYFLLSPIPLTPPRQPCRAGGERRRSPPSTPRIPPVSVPAATPGSRVQCGLHLPAARGQHPVRVGHHITLLLVAGPPPEVGAVRRRCGHSAMSLGSSLLGYSMPLLTRYGLGDDGCVVVRVVTRVEKMVVQCPVKPVVEELDRPHVKQDSDDGSIGSPHWHDVNVRDGCVAQWRYFPATQGLLGNCIFARAHAKYNSCQSDLPGPFPVHLLEVKTAVDNEVLPASSLVSRETDPNLVVDHPQQQSRQHEGVRWVKVSPPLGGQPVRRVHGRRSQDQVLCMDREHSVKYWAGGDKLCWNDILSLKGFSDDRHQVITVDLQFTVLVQLDHKTA